jgi:hypothetical protein
VNGVVLRGRSEAMESALSLIRQVIRTGQGGGLVDRAKQVAVVRELTAIAAAAAADESLTERTWVLLTQAPDGGWGLDGHANTNDELVALARAQIAEIKKAQ